MTTTLFPPAVVVDIKVRQRNAALIYNRDGSVLRLRSTELSSVPPRVFDDYGFIRKRGRSKVLK